MGAQSSSQIAKEHALEHRADQAEYHPVAVHRLAID